MADTTNDTGTVPATSGTPATTTPATAAAAAPKVKDVLNDMDSRRILPNPTEATAYIGKCMTDYPDFGKYPVAAPGVSVTEEGALAFDPTVYGEGVAVMVAVLTQRGDGPNQSTVKAIVIAPIPTFEAILANPGGNAWAKRILEKELNHVAVRQLRKAENVADAVDSMPKTLEDYITSDRGAGGILQAYEDLWRPIKNNMAKLSRSWRLANLSKKELRRALESSAYAREYYPTLEETKQGSLFVFALNGLIVTAKKQGLDPTIFERWLAGRDEATIEVKDDDDEEFDEDALLAAMTAAPALTQNEGESDEDFAARQAAATATPEPTATEPASSEEPTEENTAPPAA